MKRGEVADTIARGIGPEPVVVCSLGSTSRAWRDVGAPNPTYYASDPMGLAGSLALGLALALRPRRVLHLAGDGDLMLNLGVLVAIAGAPPCSLAVVVFANRRYETGGGQPLAGGPHTSLAAIAAGAGLRVLPSPSNPLELLASTRALWEGAGTGFCVVPVEPEPSPYGGPGEWSGVEERVRFLQQLGRTSGKA